MIQKQRRNNRILSLVLALVMVLSMLPVAGFTAFAVSASATPVIRTDASYVAAFGTPIYIEAGTAEGHTVVWYYKNDTKTYLTDASGQDLSGYTVYGGAPPVDTNHYKDGSEWNFDWRTITATSITMTGGTLNNIVANSYLNYDSSASLLITGGTADYISFGNPYGKNSTSTGLVLIDIGKIYDNDTAYFDGIYKSDNTYIASGTAEIPSDFELTVGEGETLSVPQGASLTNNGTIVNNGTVTVDGTLTNDGTINNNSTVTVDGELTNNGTISNAGTVTVNSAPDKIGIITGSGKVNRNAAYIATDSSGTLSVWVDGSEVTGFTTEYTDGKLYIYNVTGNIKATLDGTEYYGVQKDGSSTELTADYKHVTDISGIPAEIVANKPVTLKAELFPELTTFATNVSYFLEDAGDTGAVLNSDILTAYKPGTVKIKVTAADGYSTYSEDFDITVKHIAVTGLSGEVPSEITVGAKITLPTAVPAEASYTDIDWLIVSGQDETGASISNGVLTATKAGPFTVRATIKNGGADYGKDYTEDFTVTASAADTIDISLGSVTISEQDGKLRVVYSGFSGGSKDYDANERIVITGTTTTNSVTVESGSPNVELSDCSITNSASPFSIASGAKVNLMLKGSNVLKNTGSYAGLSVPQGAAVVISGDGSLEAAGGEQGSGIGGRSNGAGGTVTITGGTVKATGGNYGAGIGGGYMGNGGTVTVNGGTVTATGGIGTNGGGSGIGGGYSGNGGTVTVNGGTVTATGSGGGAGIGGGSQDAGGTVTITGGTVTAIGGTNGSESGGAGIGSGYAADGGTVEITGGTVTATGGINGAGIGGGRGGDGGTVKITGGTVTATSGRSGGDGFSGAGIGGGGNGNGGAVTITGGSIKATAHNPNAEAIGKGSGNSSPGTLTDGTNNLKLVTVTLAGLSDKVPVGSIAELDNYGMKDVVTMDGGKLYLYLPENGESLTQITLENGTYYGKMNADTSSATFYKIDKSQEPDKDADGYYLIADIDDLIWFSYASAAALGNPVNGRVTADIDASGSEFTTIGNADAPYAGTFDGGFHKITVGINAAEDYAALFDYVKGATIENLIVDGSITTSAKFASGLIGSSTGTTTVKNVISNVVITSSVNGDGTHGGFVGTASGTLVMENCGFAGAINGSSTNSCGGFIGWANGGTSITIKDSYLAADFGVSETSGHTIARNYAGASVNITNFYYLDALNETPSSNQITKKTENQFKNGEVTYLLNNGTTDGTQVWYQTIGTHAHPVFEGEIVYYDDQGYYNHFHAWEYTADGSKITATCTENGCPNNKGGSVTVAKPGNLTYDGGAKDATLSYTDWKPEEKPTITYSGEADRENVTGKDITASITLGGATAAVTYQVEAVPVRAATVAVTAPEAGEAKQTAVAGGDHYSAAITWDCDTDNFGYNTAYTATVTLTANKNYAFVSNLAVTGWDVALSADRTTATLTKKYEKTRKAKLTDISAPTDTTLNKYHTNAEDAIQELPTTVTYTAESGSVTADIQWTCSNYDHAVSKTNTFTWTVRDGELDSYDNANGIATSGEITVTNVSVIAVEISGENRTVTYSGSTWDVSQMFTVDGNAGEKAYAITGGTGEGTLKGSVLTVTKAGTFEIRLTTAANGPYAPGEATATLTVNKGAGSGTVTIEGWTYGEDAKAPVVSSSTNGTAGATCLYESTDGRGYTGPAAPENAGNYKLTVTFAETDLYAACTAEAVFTVKKANPEIGTVTAEAVYDTLETSAVVLNRANTAVDGVLTVDAGQTLKPGDNELAYTFTPADNNYESVTGKVTVTVKLIESVGKPLDGITQDNVTSDDRETVQNVIDRIDALLADADLPEDKKAALEELREEAEKLIEKIEEANKPADTNSPTTGDTTNPWLWVALLFVSGAVIAFTVYDGKKRTVK